MLGPTMPRTRGVTVTAAALALVAGIWFSLSDTPDPGTASTAAHIIASQADSAVVMTSARGWGTEIHIELDGLPARESYVLWVIDSDGAWLSAAC